MLLLNTLRNSFLLIAFGLLSCSLQLSAAHPSDAAALAAAAHGAGAVGPTVPPLPEAGEVTLTRDEKVRFFLEMTAFLNNPKYPLFSLKPAPALPTCASMRDRLSGKSLIHQCVGFNIAVWMLEYALGYGDCMAHYATSYWARHQADRHFTGRTFQTKFFCAPARTTPDSPSPFGATKDSHDGPTDASFESRMDLTQATPLAKSAEGISPTPDNTLVYLSAEFVCAAMQTYEPLFVQPYLRREAIPLAVRYLTDPHAEVRIRIGGGLAHKIEKIVYGDDHNTLSHRSVDFLRFFHSLPPTTFAATFLTEIAPLFKIIRLHHAYCLKGLSPEEQALKKARRGELSDYEQYDYFYMTLLTNEANQYLAQRADLVKLYEELRAELNKYRRLLKNTELAEIGFNRSKLDPGKPCPPTIAPYAQPNLIDWEAAITDSMTPGVASIVAPSAGAGAGAPKIPRYKRRAANLEEFLAAASRPLTPEADELVESPRAAGRLTVAPTTMVSPRARELFPDGSYVAAESRYFTTIEDPTFNQTVRVYRVENNHETLRAMPYVGLPITYHERVQAHWTAKTAVCGAVDASKDLKDHALAQAIDHELFTWGIAHDVPEKHAKKNRYNLTLIVEITDNTTSKTLSGFLSYSFAHIRGRWTCFHRCLTTYPQAAILEQYRNKGYLNIHFPPLEEVAAA